MSHKLIHLTTRHHSRKVCFHADRIIGIQENEKNTLILTPGPEDSDIVVAEPYDQVLRIWADALSE